MTFVYHIVTIRVNETSWAQVWRLRFRYLRTGYDTSSHPSRRERESERETTSRSRAGQSRWLRGRTDAITVVLESQPQRTTGRTASPPAAVGLDAALLATRQLLNNPPLIGVSPSVAEQWSHDVDQLIIVAINTPHHERWCPPSAQQSCFPSAVCAPSVAQAPPVLPGARPLTQHRTRDG
jgi:hypothetical protein